MKKHAGARELIYVCMNHLDQYVLSYGIEFAEFLKGIPVQPPNLLLLRHKFDEGHFNMHTLLDYVDHESLNKLAVSDVYGYGDFCWIDFEDEEDLNQLSGQEIAELLYLSHLKEHLRPPFYSKLDNKFAYLAHDDGWKNKTYYKTWTDFYTMLGAVISEKLNGQNEKSLFSRWRKKHIPTIPIEVLHTFSGNMREGIVISLEKAERNRSQIEIPVWLMGDFYDMDEMYESYESLAGKKPDGKITLDRKVGEWQAFSYTDAQ